MTRVLLAASEALASGSSRTTLVPTPSSLESAREPPIDSTRPRASARPRPVPSIPRLAASSRSNGVNSRPIASSEMPAPVSATSIRTAPASVRPALTTTLPPRRLYLTAFESRLSSTCIRR